MKAKKIFLGSFLGALLAAIISSTYFYAFFRKSAKRLNEGLDYRLDKWEDIKNF